MFFWHHCCAFLTLDFQFNLWVLMILFARNIGTPIETLYNKADVLNDVECWDWIQWTWFVVVLPWRWKPRQAPTFGATKRVRSAQAAAGRVWPWWALHCSRRWLRRTFYGLRGGCRNSCGRNPHWRWTFPPCFAYQFARDKQCSPHIRHSAFIFFGHHVPNSKNLLKGRPFGRAAQTHTADGHGPLACLQVEHGRSQVVWWDGCREGGIAVLEPKVIEQISGKKTLKVCRIAGQYGKPRSKPTELLDGKEIMSFKAGIYLSYLSYRFAWKGWKGIVLTPLHPSSTLTWKSHIYLPTAPGRQH